MLNSLSLRQQHFLYQRKNLYIPILGRIFSSEPVPEDTNMQLARWSLSFYLSGFPGLYLGSGTRPRGFPEAPEIQGGWWGFLDNWL